MHGCLRYRRSQQRRAGSSRRLQIFRILPGRRAAARAAALVGAGWERASWPRTPRTPGAVRGQHSCTGRGYVARSVLAPCRFVRPPVVRAPTLVVAPGPPFLPPPLPLTPSDGAQGSLHAAAPPAHRRRHHRREDAASSHPICAHRARPRQVPGGRRRAGCGRLRRHGRRGRWEGDAAGPDAGGRPAMVHDAQNPHLSVVPGGRAEAPGRGAADAGEHQRQLHAGRWRLGGRGRPGHALHLTRQRKHLGRGNHGRVLPGRGRGLWPAPVHFRGERDAAAARGRCAG